MGMTQVSWSFEKVIQALEYNRGQHSELNCIADISLLSEVQVRNKISDYQPMLIELF